MGAKLFCSAVADSSVVEGSTAAAVVTGSHATPGYPQTHHWKERLVGMKKASVTALLAGVSVAAIATAPIAAAAPAANQSALDTTTSASSGADVPQPCLGLGSTQSECQSPGNVQINDSPPQVDYYPYAGGAT
jgi:hypothetical protein